MKPCKHVYAIIAIVNTHHLQARAITQNIGKQVAVTDRQSTATITTLYDRSLLEQSRTEVHSSKSLKHKQFQV